MKFIKERTPGYGQANYFVCDCYRVKSTALARALGVSTRTINKRAQRFDDVRYLCGIEQCAGEPGNGRIKPRENWRDFFEQAAAMGEGVKHEEAILPDSVHRHPPKERARSREELRGWGFVV